MKAGRLTCRMVIWVNLLSFNVLTFCSEEEKGLWGRKGVWGGKTRQNANICFQSMFVSIKIFCQIKEMNCCTVFEGWCNSFCSLWASTQLVSFCRLEELWFTVWGILTVGSQVLTLSKHSIGYLFLQGVFWQMAVAKKIHHPLDLHKMLAGGQLVLCVYIHLVLVVSSFFCAPGMKQFLLCSCWEWHRMNCIILSKVTAGTGSTGKTVQHRMKSHPTAQSPDVNMNWREKNRRTGKGQN